MTALSLRSISRRSTALLAAFLAAFATLFWPTFAWMAERFDAPDSFYSHGWLIPLVGGWLIWQRRQALERCTIRPSLAGLALLVPAVLVHVAATRWQLHVMSGAAMLAAVWGLVWTVWGRDVVRILRVPLLFLAFMVPLPGVLLIAVSFQLKMAAASLATHLLMAVGLAAQQAGSTIHLPGVSIVVDETCSGLRSLISLLALATLWAALMPRPVARWQQAALIMASVPIALLANMVRILVLTLVALLHGAAAAKGFIHVGSGIVVFGVALVLLAWCDWLIRRVRLPRSAGRT